jgi:hypothetical protein
MLISGIKKPATHEILTNGDSPTILFVTKVALYVMRLENQFTLFTFFGDPTTNFHLFS